MLGWGKNKEPEKGKTRSGSAAGAPSGAPTPRSDTHLRKSPTHPASSQRAGLNVAPGETLEKVLLTAGGVTPEQMREALTRQQEQGGFLGQILMDMGVIAEGSLTSILARHCKMPHLSLLDYLIDEKILGLVPREVCLKFRLLPIDKLGRNLTVAMVNPLDAEARRVLYETCPELRIKPILCANAHFESVAARLFAEETGHEAKELSATSFGLQASKSRKKPASPTPPQQTPPPEKDQPPIDDTVVPDELDGEPAASDAVVSSCFADEALATDPPEEPEPQDAPASTTKTPSPDDTSLMMRQMMSAMRSSMRETYSVLARRVATFHGLPPETVAKVFAKGATRECDAGEVIFRKGDYGDDLFIILNGQIRIIDGERELAVLESGGMFGEMALFSKEPRSASAVAQETTSLLTLSEDAIHSVVPPEAAIKILVNIITMMSERLRLANQK